MSEPRVSDGRIFNLLETGPLTPMEAHDLGDALLADLSDARTTLELSERTLKAYKRAFALAVHSLERTEGDHVQLILAKCLTEAGKPRGAA